MNGGNWIISSFCDIIHKKVKIERNHSLTFRFERTDIVQNEPNMAEIIQTLPCLAPQKRDKKSIGYWGYSAPIYLLRFSPLYHGRVF